jgi:ribosome-binding protein aMBF1 (putative translation factor)
LLYYVEEAPAPGGICLEDLANKLDVDEQVVQRYMTQWQQWHIVRGVEDALTHSLCYSIIEEQHGNRSDRDVHIHEVT